MASSQYVQQSCEKIGERPDALQQDASKLGEGQYSLQPSCEN